MRELTPLQTDVLKEVTNVGAGHAATALAQLAGVTISIDVPRIWTGTLVEVVARVAADGSHVVVVSMRVLGDLAGQILFVMPKSGAAALVDILLNRTPGSGKLESAMERSGLQETGNILASSFLNALARWMGNILLPSVPTVTIDDPDTVVKTIWDADGEKVLAAETSFTLAQKEGEGLRLSGVLVFLLEGPSLERILTAMRVK